MPFADVVRTRVCEPAGMRDTVFLRSDEPGERTALGYLDGDGLRTNVLHLPVVGSGDGGIYSTAADIHALWSALYAGRIVRRTGWRRGAPAGTCRRSRCATDSGSGCTRRATR